MSRCSHTWHRGPRAPIGYITPQKATAKMRYVGNAVRSSMAPHTMASEMEQKTT